ncbi:MATE family efflux transporter [Siphonobacter sp. SORGH_AS_0500]|uniref:MATE family efflux transporter n=1 Tax=Siphonobacter sp. SORGH_AS_0500 TaxID=1864824 RepID=UPI00286118B6|nr:MATE family efflux transporter [Siphonobacter sp. SORGH_AS_0500]MDR6193279.1 putative MATE family efflux protein [Siphonobacter sp. SORGH_AS_0500]
MIEKEKQLILNGALTTVLWQLAWPAVLAMVLYGLNSFLDGVFVGQLMNQDALAGVGMAYPLSQITLGLGSLVGTGAGTVLSIWLGANEKARLSQLLGTVNLLCLLLAVVVCLPLYGLAEPLVRALGARGAVLGYGSSYFRVTILGSFFWIHGLALNMMVRGEGKMKTAAWMIAVGLIVDVALKPIFIQTFGWGVDGAAWATNTGMLVYSLVGLWYFATGRASFASDWKTLRLPKDLLGSILKSGLPGMILTLMTVIQSIVVLHAITHYGTDADLPFYTACNRILLFLMTPMIGLMRALQPVVGMNYGAGRYDRVRRSYWLFTACGAGLIVPVWLFMTLFPLSTIHSILPGIAVSTQQLTDFRVYLAVLPFLPIVFMVLVTLPSIEKAKQTSLIALLRQVIFYLPVMLFFPRFFGVRAIYWGSTLIDVVVILMTLGILLKSFKELGAGEDRVMVSEISS